MIAFIVGLSWGLAIGVVLTLWATLRYCSDLHQRISRLETPKRAATMNPTNVQLDRITAVVLGEIAHDLADADAEYFEDEDWDDDDPAVQKH